MSDQSALERIRQNLSARLVELLHQGVVDAARQSSGEAFCQAGVSRISAQECFAVRSAGTGLLAREEYCPHLDGLGAKGRRCHEATGIPDASRGDHRYRYPVD